MVRSRRTLVALLALAACAVPASAYARTWVVQGAGFGHGVGMGAYGAYGLGKHGTKYKGILGHYFNGTKVKRKRGASTVKVLLSTTSGGVSFSRATSACGERLRPTRTYRAERNGGSMVLAAGSGRRIAGCGRLLHATGRGRVKIGGLGTYRGALNAVASGSGVNVVNEVGVNAYAQGVLPGEIFPSWPKETLKAFAIAARSVALATDVGGDGYDIYADTRTQVYEGAGEETKRTNAAVRATRDEVLTYRGRVVEAFYHSSSGGRTTDRFLGGPRIPWVRSVKDPYDRLSPLHRWTFRFTQAEIDSKLDPYVKGKLRRVEVLRRGDTPRIDLARLVGSRGGTRVRGDTLQVALGLPDRWASFRKR